MITTQKLFLIIMFACSMQVNTAQQVIAQKPISRVAQVKQQAHHKYGQVKKWVYKYRRPIIIVTGTIAATWIGYRIVRGSTSKPSTPPASPSKQDGTQRSVNDSSPLGKQGSNSPTLTQSVDRLLSPSHSQQAPAGTAAAISTTAEPTAGKRKTRTVRFEGEAAVKPDGRDPRFVNHHQRSDSVESVFEELQPPVVHEPMPDTITMNIAMSGKRKKIVAATSPIRNTTLHNVGETRMPDGTIIYHMSYDEYDAGPSAWYNEQGQKCDESGMVLISI